MLAGASSLMTKLAVAAHRSTRIILASVVLSGGLMLPGATIGTHTAGALLPDLAMLQPDDFRVERKTGGVRWLRFSTTIVNIGDGPFDVYGFEPTGGAISGISELNVTQRLLEAFDPAGDRIWSEHQTPATMFYAGDGHDHWHVFGLQEWDLAFEATPNDTIATGAKTGFCFWDNVNLGWGTPAEYFGSSACHLSGDGARVPMGQAVGWGDEYPSTIAFQYVDITAHPYGEYCLTLTADPRGEFIEKETANNTARTLISIRKNGVTVLATDCGNDTIPPVPPTELTATAGDTTVALDWAENAETDFVAGYHVYRDTGPTPIATVTSSAYTDTGLTNGTPYCYEVTASDGSGNESARSSPAVCATPAAGSGNDTMHVGDLDGRVELKGKSGRWGVFVTVAVHDSAHTALGDVTVNGTFSDAASASVSGTTAADGTVTFATGTLAGGDSVTFTVTGLAGTLGYDSTANHDPDLDSDGTTITVTKP